MKNTAVIFFLVCFIAASIVIPVLAEYNSPLYVFVKPLLMPLLILALASFKTTIPGKTIIITGLFFAWAGDALLLFEKKDAFFFTGGLVSFLITHTCYIIYLLKIRSTNRSLVRDQPWVASLVAAYGVSLVMFLSPHLGDMKIPVMLYAAVICTMVICSLHVFNKVNKAAAVFFVAGALLFAASDSLLAVNKFYKPFSYAGPLIIATYCAAQFLIVMAVMKREK